MLYFSLSYCVNCLLSAFTNKDAYIILITIREKQGGEENPKTVVAIVDFSGQSYPLTNFVLDSLSNSNCTQTVQ